jgi:hypothetical protein
MFLYGKCHYLMFLCYYSPVCVVSVITFSSCCVVCVYMQISVVYTRVKKDVACGVTVVKITFLKICHYVNCM